MELDHEALASQLIRALRGRRSQVGFSRRLGFASNVLYTWEAGRRWPSASQFLRAAERSGVDVDVAMREFAGPPGWPDEVPVTTTEGVARLLRTLKGTTPIVHAAERAGRSRFAVSRWLKGTAEPRLPDFLRLVGALSLRTLDFVSRFTDPAELAAARTAWRRLEQARAMARASPWAQALLLALELESYRALDAHDPHWLADRMALPLDEVQRAIDQLLAAGQATWKGPHLAPVTVQTVDVRGPASASRGPSLKAHWAEVSLARLRAEREGLWSYNVFAVSHADLARIGELQRAHYRAIRSIVADSSPAERVVLLNLQLVPLA